MPPQKYLNKRKVDITQLLKKYNKKGNVFDSINIGVVLLYAAFFFIIAIVIISRFNSAVQATNVDAQSKQVSSELNVKIPQVFDSSFLVMYVGFALVAIIGAYQTNIAKYFAAFSIVILGIIVIISMAFSNIYDSVSNNTLLATYFSSMPIMTFIMNNYVGTILIIGFAIFLALYAKPNASNT